MKDNYYQNTPNYYPDYTKRIESSYPYEAWVPAYNKPPMMAKPKSRQPKSKSPVLTKKRSASKLTTQKSLDEWVFEVLWSQNSIILNNFSKIIFKL